MGYTLEEFSADCRAALLKDSRSCRARARASVHGKSKLRCGFCGQVSRSGSRKSTEEYFTRIPIYTFAFLHTYIEGARNSPPHDHGPSWAIYSQVSGVTEMTDWRLLQKPANGAPARSKRFAPTSSHRDGPSL